ncbi:hypothetical protein [Paenibacillus sinopodophylli]|uniref:hypothetical protein n=1 Tax=Paenibacillus sinopodophylli TaxID=1837342 RepID=UPI00110D0CDF|nr:hypothetical protein [Paenibacillus sinopodophylli]
MGSQLRVTFSRLDQGLIEGLERQITERLDKDLDSDVLQMFEYLIMSRDVAWDHIEQQQREIEKLKHELFNAKSLRDFAVKHANESRSLNQEEKGHGPIVIHQNEDGSVQLRDNLTRFWCACGQPAVEHFENELPQYRFQCIKHAHETRNAG